MAAPGLPDWLQRPWYRFNHAFIFASATLGFSFRFEGVRQMPRRGPVLVVANHQCFLDPVLVGLAVTRTLHYMARKSLFDNPVLGAFLPTVNVHPVDNAGAATGGVRAVLEVLKAGHPVLLFPEGERTHTGKMQPLKAGVHLLAKRARRRSCPSASPAASSRSRARPNYQRCRRCSCRPRAAPWRRPSANRWTRNAS